MDNYLVPLVDGGIIEIEYDSKSNEGCETCDYGSSYVDEYTIKMGSGKIKVEVSQMYEHALSEGFMMELFITNVDVIKLMTEDSFYEWLQNEVAKHNKGNHNEPTATFEFVK